VEAEIDCGMWVIAYRRLINQAAVAKFAREEKKYVNWT
jgi:hypothetical protein